MGNGGASSSVVPKALFHVLPMEYKDKDKAFKPKAYTP